MEKRMQLTDSRKIPVRTVAASATGAVTVGPIAGACRGGRDGTGDCRCLLREIHIRVALFAVAVVALLIGYHTLLFERAPAIFNSPTEDMSFGWYVPLFSLYVVWTERRKIVESVGPASIWGLFLIVPCAFAGFLGVRGAQIRFEIVGLVGLLIGLVWTMFGARTARQVLFPALFLLFCIPLQSYLDIVTVHLRLMAVSAAYEILKGCGVDIVREGTMLFSPSGAFSIDVADPCSGLRSLFAMMALTAGYSYFTQPTWFRRALLFALAMPIAIVGNVVRVLSIVTVAATCSSDFATGFYHDYSGYVVFLVAVFLMVATGGLITKGAERCAMS